MNAVGLGNHADVDTIHAPLDAGMTLIDTADSYHTLQDEIGYGEMLTARALASYGADTSQVLLVDERPHMPPIGRHSA